jgi:alpha-beta hydrolase superfamily lysophospholipase
VHVPAHDSSERMAAALLLAGSGPTDRNGDVPRLGVMPRTMEMIADALGGLGIMSLRFDKYFSGQTGAGAFASDPGRVDLAAFIRQAEAAYDVLREQPEAKQDSLLVAGHSEGGLYALLLASQAEPLAGRTEPRPAGVALLEPLADQLLNSILFQVTEHLDGAVAAGTVDPQVAAGNVEGARRAIGQFRAGQPVETDGLLPDVVRMLAPELLTTQNERYVRADDAVRPTEVAARIAPGTRVLVTAGTRDANIPVATIEPLAAALARVGTTGPGLRVLDGVDHFLTNPGETALAASVTAALAEWAQPFARCLSGSLTSPWLCSPGSLTSPWQAPGREGPSGPLRPGDREARLRSPRAGCSTGAGEGPRGWQTTSPMPLGPGVAGDPGQEGGDRGFSGGGG